MHKRAKQFLKELEQLCLAYDVVIAPTLGGPLEVHDLGADLGADDLVAIREAVDATED